MFWWEWYYKNDVFFNFKWKFIEISQGFAANVRRSRRKTGTLYFLQMVIATPAQGTCKTTGHFARWKYSARRRCRLLRQPHSCGTVAAPSPLRFPRSKTSLRSCTALGIASLERYKCIEIFSKLWKMFPPFFSSLFLSDSVLSVGIGISMGLDLQALNAVRSQWRIPSVKFMCFHSF